LTMLIAPIHQRPTDRGGPSPVRAMPRQPTRRRTSGNNHTRRNNRRAGSEAHLRPTEHHRTHADQVGGAAPPPRTRPQKPGLGHAARAYLVRARQRDRPRTPNHILLPHRQTGPRVSRSFRTSQTKSLLSSQWLNKTSPCQDPPRVGSSVEELSRSTVPPALEISEPPHEH